MQSTFLVSVFLLCLISQINGQQYFITASKYARIGGHYIVNVQINEADGPVTIKAWIDVQNNYRSPPRSYGEVEAIFKQPSAGLPTIGTLNMSLANILGDRFYNTKLKIEASGGLAFNASKSMSIETKTKSIFIQTDKVLYKPGQTVLMRVLAVGPNLKPFLGPIDVQIIDSKRNKIRAWQNHTTPLSKQYGVVNFSLPISDQPNMGVWKIKAKVGNEEVEKEFEIAEYVLPKFEVTVEGPDYFLFRGNSLTATVVAKYTFGKNVDGKADIRIRLQFYESRTYGRNKGSITKTIPLKSGRAEIILTEDELLAMKFPPDRCLRQRTLGEINLCHRGAYQGEMYMTETEIVIEANVTEELTGKVLSGSTDIPIKHNSIETKILPITPGNFKPGLEYAAFIQVSMVSGKPLEQRFLQKSPKMEVTASTSTSLYGGERNEIKIGIYDIDETGIVVARFTVPGDVRSFTLVSNTTDPLAPSDSKRYIVSRKYNIGKFESKRNASIQVMMNSQDGSIKPGQIEKFTIKATEPIPVSFHSVLLSKGNLVKAATYKTIETLRPGSTSGDYAYDFDVNFNAVLVQKLAPSARLIVWYITLTDELIADTMDLNVEGGIKNQVTAKMTPNDTKPAEMVNIDIMASPDSYVGLVAVDQSTKLLTSGDRKAGFTIDDLEAEQKRYDPSDQFVTPWYWRRGIIDRRKKRTSVACYGCWWPINVGGDDTSEVLDRAGLIIISDIYIHEKIEDFVIERDGGPFLEAARVNAPLPGAAGGVQDNDFADGSRLAKTGSGSGTPNSVSKPLTVRQEFPETWIWQSEFTRQDGTVGFQAKVPDTITTWVLDAFAVNDVDGLGVARESAKVRVFKPFFVSLSLPYSVIYGEEFELNATVFNYLTTKVEVTVILKNSDKHFKSYENGVKNEMPTDADVMRKVEVPANEGVTLQFWIKPTKLGQIPLTVSAITGKAGDIVKRMLLVEPEGAAEEFAISQIVNSTGNTNKQTWTLEADIPRDKEFFVPGSEFLKVTAIGDIMGKSLSNLGHLVRMPYGCGEQNMVNFAPNIFVRKYLVATSQLTPEIEEKTDRFMQSGYERELTYQRDDGSFSAFGNRDKQGSTWLTAFVLKSFGQARPYIDVDPAIIEITAQYIARRQTSVGDFEERGKTPNGRLVGGSSSHGKVALTAYILIALIENKDILNDTRSMDVMNKAQDYIERNIVTARNNPYTLAIVYLALVQRGSSAAPTVREYLFEKAIREDGSLHWEEEVKVRKTTSSRGWRPRYNPIRSTDVEMTAYALMGILHTGDIENAIQITKWLIGQTNAQGGYASTQDTVIGLQALAEVAVKTYGTVNCVGSGLQLSVTPSSSNSSNPMMFQSITDLNTLLLQTIEPPKDTRSVDIVAEGCGFALVQLQYSYHVKKVEDEKIVEVKTDPVLTDDHKHVDLHTCTKWLDANESSGMAVVEFTALSGFEFDSEGLLAKYQDKGVKRVENGDGKIVLYLDEIPTVEMCISLRQDQVNFVSNMQDAKVSVFSYYQPERRNTGFYLPSALRGLTRCDVCPQCCEALYTTTTDVSENTVVSQQVSLSSQTTSMHPQLSKEENVVTQTRAVQFPQMTTHILDSTTDISENTRVSQQVTFSSQSTSMHPQLSKEENVVTQTRAIHLPQTTSHSLDSEMGQTSNADVITRQSSTSIELSTSAQNVSTELKQKDFEATDGEPTNVVPPITDDNSSAQTISLEIACLLLTLSLAFINRIL